MAMTPAQLEAVQARGNVIVVAGAGTGKTSTLVERVLALLTEGCSIERLLMVTFTDAAAAEMRHRLRLRLAATTAQSDDAVAGRWQEQLALLDTARIGTLHSFCLQLIRENFHRLGIDPAVKVLDETQTRPLIEVALDECLAPHFAGADTVSAAVREVIRRYAGGDPERIRGLILKLHRHAQTLPSPERWFGEQLAALACEQPGQWRGWVAAELRRWAEEWLPEVGGNAREVENLRRCAKALRGLGVPPSGGPANGDQRPAKAGTPNTAADALAEILAADAAEWKRGTKGKFRDPLKKFFAEAEFLASQFELTPAGEGLAADWQNVRGGLTALLTLAREFAEKFAAAKRELGGLDFGDLEQFALRLLVDDEGRPTAVAAEWRQTFEHVFVDECQDINAAQDAIIAAVSRGSGESGNIEHRTSNTELRSEEGKLARESAEEAKRQTGNRFLVGDVKQSIYQFRLARPALFRGYEQAWQDGVNGKRILLADNFRSHPEVIGFVNAFFEPLMRASVGGVAYEKLKAGREDGAQGPAEAGTPNPERRVEFHLVPKRDAAEPAGEEAESEAADGAADVGDLLAVEREARTVALRLRALKESGFAIWDKQAGCARPVGWRDMAVLLRSPRSRVEAFAKEFHRCGVPLQAERGGFLDSTEVSDLLSLVRLLDNPLQDIPLLAVLRSPLVAMSLDELAQIRIASRARRLWIAVREFHQKGRPASVSLDRQDACPTTAWQKVDWFLQHFAKWRELARQASLSHCLETALSDTHYVAVTQVGERGGERVANVRKFIGLVRQYDPYQRQGVFRFLRFIESLQAADQQIDPAPAVAQDAVRLMSIHKSKGLEFPVVAVACLGTTFNAGDQRADVLVDEDLGVCARAVAASGAKHPTWPHWLAAQRQRRQLLGEELRLLYVAMTRARDRLILTGTARKQDADQWEAEPGRTFADRVILKAQSALDWVLLWLPRVTRVEELGRDEVANEWFRWRVCRAEPEVPSLRGELAGSEAGVSHAEDSALVAEVTRRIRWQYPHAPAADEPAKTTVTALRRKAAEEDEDASPWQFVEGAHRRDTQPSADSLDAAAAGTLHHEFLQLMALSGAGDVADLRGQLAALVATGGLGANAVAAVDVAALAEFWTGEVGAMIRANANAARRELPFTARFTPPELEQITGAPANRVLADEFVVVQGVADLAVLLPTEIWLLDFKTDAVSGRQLDERVEKYRPQLALYAAALAGIYQRPVTRRWLHFIRARQTVAV